jgi:hypothetical protein
MKQFIQRIKLAWEVLCGRLDPNKSTKDAEELERYRELLWGLRDSYDHWRNSGYKSYDYQFSCWKDIDKLLEAGKKLQ